MFLNKEKILGYFNTCEKLAEEIEESAIDGYKNILMPSRGVYPLYKVAQIINNRKFMSTPLVVESIQGDLDQKID